MATYVTESCVATYTATATSLCVTSANANVVGILWSGSATGAIQIWSGVTATATALATTLSGIIRFTAPEFRACPANCIGGFTISSSIASDPSFTLFWNPT